MTVFLGWSPNEMVAANVADYSLRATSGMDLDVRRLALLQLRAQKLYTRPTEYRYDGTLWDVISDAPMTTEHAISRFLVPHLMNYQGWALFVDGDVLFRADVRELFALADPQYAVQVVKHPPLYSQAPKKAGMPQTVYARKNWSSVILWNCGHPAHRDLTPAVNVATGRDLHRFGWLEDDQIGPLPPSWNHLVGVSPLLDDVHLAHFTLGVPTLPGHESDPFAEEWFRRARQAGYRLEAPEAAAV